MYLDDWVAKRDCLLGGALYDWIGTIELVKEMVNAVQRISGDKQTVWVECRKGKLYSVYDRDVIKIFTDMADYSAIKPIADRHQCAVQLLNEAIDARNVLVHEVGRKSSEHLRSSTDISVAIQEEIAVINRCTPDIKKSLTAMNGIAMDFMARISPNSN